MLKEFIQPQPGTWGGILWEEVLRLNSLEIQPEGVNAKLLFEEYTKLMASVINPLKAPSYTPSYAILEYMHERAEEIRQKTPEKYKEINGVLKLVSNSFE